MRVSFVLERRPSRQRRPAEAGIPRQNRAATREDKERCAILAERLSVAGRIPHFRLRFPTRFAVGNHPILGVRVRSRRERLRPRRGALRRSRRRVLKRMPRTSSESQVELRRGVQASRDPTHDIGRHYEVVLRYPIQPVCNIDCRSLLQSSRDETWKNHYSRYARLRTMRLAPIVRGRAVGKTDRSRERMECLSLCSHMHP